MSSKYSSYLQFFVFVLALAMIGIGILLLFRSSATGQVGVVVPSVDSTYSSTLQVDSLKNRITTEKTVSVKNYKSASTPTSNKSECDDCIKLRFDNAYKLITLGILIIFLLFLMPFLQEFNILGIFSGKFRERLERMTALSNQVEQATAKAPLEKPELTVREAKPSLESFDKVIEGKPVIAYSGDPQKSKWGGKSENNNRKLFATVTPDPIYKEIFDIKLKVVSTDMSKPLKGSVTFHLHDSFANTNPLIFVKDGQATLELKAWGAFTVGVEADNGATRLELDLAELSDAPEVFKSR